MIFTVASGAAAQGLNKEIRVEREIEPVERPAVRLSSVNPALYSPELNHRRLTPGEYDGRGEITRDMQRLEPAAWRDTMPVSPYRGYIAGGYFPTFNAGIAAGYRLINNTNTTLDARAMYNGYRYKDKTSNDGSLSHPLTHRANNVGLGLDLRGDYTPGAFIANLNAGFGGWAMPTIDPDYTQSSHQVDFGAQWRTDKGRFPWHVALKVGNFGYGKALYRYASYRLFGNEAGEIRKNTETTFAVRGGLDFSLKGHRAGVDVDARFQKLDALTPFSYRDGIFRLDKGETLGIVSFIPHYQISRKHFDVRLGARIEVLTGGTDNALFIAPDIHATWIPSGQISAYAQATGGKKLNTLADLHDYTVYQVGSMGYQRSSVPLDIEAGLNVGPFQGFSACLSAGYSKAEDWLTPATFHGSRAPFFTPIDLDAIRYGLRLSYDYRGLVKVFFDGQGAANDKGKGYYRWRDRARWVLDAGVEVKPLKPLSITLGFETRTGRRSTYITTEINTWTPGQTDQNNSSNGTTISYEDSDMRNASNLHISGKWQFTPAFSVFANFENILCHRHYIMPHVESNGIHGLIGVEYKF